MENKQTPAEWLEETIKQMIYNGADLGEDEPALMEQIKKAKEREKEYVKEELISFQIYLNDEGYINDYDWDFEKEAKVFLFDNK